MPFPPISWWAAILGAETLYLDAHEHFEKMSYRNRYYISGSNGRIQLSVPLVHGRDQRAPMRDVQISNEQIWQVQHWRTLVSVYRRSPYFDYYEDSLRDIFESGFNHLTHFNLTTIDWVKQQLKLPLEIDTTEAYIKDYGEAVKDLRGLKPAAEKKLIQEQPNYYQVFADRTGFLPNLSILDLLFSEGPYTAQWLKENMMKP